MMFLPSSRYLSEWISMREIVINLNETRISSTVPKFETIQTSHLSLVNEISRKKKKGLYILAVTRRFD